MIKKITILIALCFFMLRPYAQDVKTLINDAGGAGDYPGQPYITIFDSTDVDVQESGLSYVHTHRLYKILNEKGAKDLGVITYGYDPLSAYVDIEKIVVHSKDGSKHYADTSLVQDYPAPARMIYWGAREKMLELGRLEPGDAVEVFFFKKGFTYALLGSDDDRYIPPMRGHYYDIVEFWSSHPILEKTFIVSIPTTKKLQYEFYNGEVRSSAVLRDGHWIYTFTKKDIMPLKREPSMVSFSDVAPKLLMSTSPDWKAKSLWFYGVNEDYGSFESTPEIDAKVAEILKEAETEMDSISLLTHWVGDEIRYSGISMGEGEGFTLHKGSMNFRDRCGVCKDKAGMLITMLRAAGFESYPAMTMAGSRIDYIPADQFNHCVTVVKMRNGQYKLLDPTWVPFLRELWSSAEQQQNYLMGVPEGADLMVTPLSPPENHYFYLKGSSELKEDGSLEGKLSLDAEGQTDASIRRMFTGYYKSEWQRMLESQLLRVAPGAEILSSDFGEPYDYQKEPLHISITYRIPDYALQTTDGMIFKPLLASHLFRGGISHTYISTSMDEREYPFRDRCSRLVEIQEKIRIPEGMEAIRLDYSKSSDGEAASYEGYVKQKGNTIEMYQKAVLNKRIYQPEDWPAVKSVVNAQNEFAEMPVILKKK